MSDSLLILRLAIELAFAVLAIRTVAGWVHQPDRRHGNLALALGSLALLILLAPDLGGPGATGQVLTDVGIVLFLVSGYGLIMFRDSFVPFGAGRTRLITVVIVAVALVGMVLQLPWNPDSPHTAAQTLELVSIIGVWAFCVLEPIPTFWLAARGLAALRGARLPPIRVRYNSLPVLVANRPRRGSAHAP